MDFTQDRYLYISATVMVKENPPTVVKRNADCPEEDILRALAHCRLDLADVQQEIL